MLGKTIYYILTATSILWIIIAGSSIAEETEDGKIVEQKMTSIEFLMLAILPAGFIYGIAWICRLLL